MNTLSTLLARHTDALDAQTRACLIALAKRQEANQAYAWPTGGIDDHTGFCKLERIFSAQPVDLFGQDAPSLAHSKLTIWRAKRAGEDLVPGDVLMSVLISEKSLTQLLFSSNRGDCDIPVTPTQLGDTPLPAYARQESPHDVAFTESMERAHAKIDSALDTIRGLLAKGANAKNRKQIATAITTLHHLVTSHAELGFYLDRRLSTYGIKRADLVSEAADAALFADRILDTPLLADHRPVTETPEQARFYNPMIDACLDYYTPTEEAALKDLLVLEMQHIGKTYGDLTTDAPTARDPNTPWPESKTFRYSNPKLAEALDASRGLANSIFNPHIVKTRRGLNAHHMGIGLSRIHGWTGFIHSSLPATDDIYYTWKIGAVSVGTHYGEGQLRGATHPLMEFSLTSDDLMMLVRGHPTGKSVPCTLRVVAGHYKRAPERDPHAFASARENIETTLSEDPRTRAIQTLLADILAHLENANTTKAWKDRLTELEHSLETAVQAYKGVLSDGFDMGDDLARTMVGTLVRADLEEMRSALPASLMHKLLADHR